MMASSTGTTPWCKHMPWFKTPDPYVTEHMMVKDLLCHRSGWITFDGDLLWYGTELDQREILERHAQRTVHRMPSAMNSDTAT